VKIEDTYTAPLSDPLLPLNDSLTGCVFECFYLPSDYMFETLIFNITFITIWQVPGTVFSGKESKGAVLIVCHLGQVASNHRDSGSSLGKFSFFIQKSPPVLNFCTFLLKNAFQ
jgi:hypothetical protein